jgi:hypothetical protein
MGQARDKYLSVLRGMNPSPRLLAAIEAAEDDEEFCPDCFAGMESSEHHEKCEAD